MRPTPLLLRHPLIKFLGKRSFPQPPPQSSAQEPQPHPASPTHDLPTSFVAYRSKAQQHGPLARSSSSFSPSEELAAAQDISASSSAPPNVGSKAGRADARTRSGHDLGAVEPGPGTGEVMDRSELPERFHVLTWTEEEIEGVEMGGAGGKVGWGAA
ncbi:MAG: hypothetical protein LQ342_008013 [Letrouitia transgressa]|nr:MAG: hypothetical protein LQ342_008013 [Letrouitia transgressa]